MLPPIVAYTYRIGADENGLGARLGPLVVTAVLARTNEQGDKTLERKLPKRVRIDLDDSKALVSHQNVELGEAWARAVCSADAASPDALMRELCLEKPEALTQYCPKSLVPQCWSSSGESFASSPDLLARVRGHRSFLAERGVEIVKVQCSVVCTNRLNDARDRGLNRFVSDLHAMERLVLAHRAHAGEDVHAVCGKVGGIAEYSKFFGPLSGYLHAIIEQGRAQSSYRFPGVGELHFVRDADAANPLVMLASLVGKYVRELLMARVSRFYALANREEEPPSGYHDPRTTRFVAATRLMRRKLRVPDTCFERARDPIVAP